MPRLATPRTGHGLNRHELSGSAMKFQRSTILSAIRLTDLLVVSLDRMGSHYANASRNEGNKEVGRFIEERNISDELQRVTVALLVDFLAEATAEERAKLARAIAELRIWGDREADMG